jgi:DNA-binding FadR family transcriptional regulator
MKTLVDFPDKYVELDKQFHEALAVAAKNQVILDLLKKLNHLYFDTRSFLYQYPDNSGMKLSAIAESHEKILECVIEKDSDKAAKLMKYYLDIGRKGITGSLK